MIIDKKLNLDIPLEYAKDNSLIFASNIVTSADGTTIQNEPALVDFVNKLNINYAGHIACNEEFVVFGKDSSIYRITKDKQITPISKYHIPWHWGGGEVYGTFTYNVNNELIVAISERNVGDAKVPLKIINLDRDIVNGYNKDDIYTLTPDIPKSNIINFQYIQGSKLKKGKYNFFIKYFINDNFETAWFPIGVPVFVYDNANVAEPKAINKQTIHVISKFNEYEVPSEGNAYLIEYNDYYNNPDDYVNTNIKLQLSISEKLNFTHYKIGYIINYDGGTEGRQTAKFNIENQSIIIGSYSELESVDNLTVGAFNIYNVNTLTNYKDRLYLANYKEENPNIAINGTKIDITNIKVSYKPDTAKERTLYNQWLSKPGRAAVYNFYLHYVYSNGNYTDGIKINSTFDNYSMRLSLGTYTLDENQTRDYYIIIDYSIRCQDIIDKINEGETTGIIDGQAVPNFIKNNYLYNECINNLNYFYYQIDPNANGGEVLEDGSITLNVLYNSNGDALYQTPINTPFNVDKLIFSGIKMYPEFIGYFISYEEPEYINNGEGLVILSNCDLGNVLENPSSNKSNRNNTKKYRFYYPEFNIVGGNINITNIVNSGNLSIELSNVAGETTDVLPGLTEDIIHLSTAPVTGNNADNDFNVTSENINVDSYKIIAPDIYSSVNNLGKEGYLELTLNNNEKIIELANNNIIQTFLAINNNPSIYLSKTKKLISLGYIKYQNYEDNSTLYSYGVEDVPYNYDFYRCYSSIYSFDRSGIIINTTDSNPTNVNKGEGYYPKTKVSVNVPNEYSYETASTIQAHLIQLKYWHETHYPLFLKELNQGPDTIFYNYYDVYQNGPNLGALGGDTQKTVNTVQKANLVLNPKYINDLYKLDPAYYSYTGKLLVNYDDTSYSSFIENYARTIRRSDVLQSESITTAWRYFRPENYKVITEDKGDITNVVGIGHYFFAHCEHSLFLFDINNALKTQDKDVQLLQPDTFDVAYQEVFTSEKGYGGLQDFVSWACDDFGYIFYNRDGKKIHRFDDGKLLDLSTGIDGVINKYLPDHIYIGADRERDRILFNFRRDNNNCVLSYSTIFNNWLSTHSYITNCEFIVLKDKLIIPYFANSTLQLKEYSADTFNSFTLPVGNVFNPGNNGESCIDVVFTDGNYNKIKVLDFITYIINKEPNDIFDTLQIEIYTNCCYSGVIDIKTERKKVSEYNKPYYDFERWNLNWFRNRIDKIENGDIIDRLSGENKNLPEKVQRGYDNALITGKYIVIRFRFKNVYKKVDVKDIQAYFKV